VATTHCHHTILTLFIKIRNVTIRQQIGLEETIIKEIEQNQFTWYGHVQRRKITQNSIKVDAETKESTRKTEKTGWKV
jgi:hypothetical protein